MMPVDLAPVRLGAAAGVLMAYVGLCAVIAWRHGRRMAVARGRRDQLATGGAGPRILVAWASQTGTVTTWAEQTARCLHDAGWRADLVNLRDLRPADLVAHERALFLVSTTGDGDPPDDALAFVRACAHGPVPSLGHLHCALLAAGDSDYPAYCAFGRWLGAWLQGAGARRWFDPVEVDRGDAAALTVWHQGLMALTGIEPQQGGSTFGGEVPWARWQLVSRQCLNPGSPGEPVCLLTLRPLEGEVPPWRSGDLVDVSPPGGQAALRTYSICNAWRPAGGSAGVLQLLVRRHRRADGSVGLASGWLCDALAEGDAVVMRLRPHPGFQLGDNVDRPLVLIGNGTGIAGLRSHLQARAALFPNGHAGPSLGVWLVFGERHPEHDAFFREEIVGWEAAGVVSRVDRVFSRDPAAGQARYVQHVLQAQAARLRTWVEAGAAVYVCGSARGMAPAVEAVLQQALGATRLEDLRAAGRYRRDVY